MVVFFPKFNKLFCFSPLFSCNRLANLQGMLNQFGNAVQPAGNEGHCYWMRQM
jgi:hypothetical protein